MNKKRAQNAATNTGFNFAIHGTTHGHTYTQCTAKLIATQATGIFRLGLASN